MVNVFRNRTTLLELNIFLTTKFLSSQLHLYSPVATAKDSSNVWIKQSAKIWNVFAWKMQWNVIENVIQACHVATSMIISYFLSENFVSFNKKGINYALYYIHFSLRILKIFILALSLFFQNNFVTCIAFSK